MPKIKLTDAKVRDIAPDPDGKQIIYWDQRLPGFGVCISSTIRSKSYVVQRLVKGKSRRITIGRVTKFVDVAIARRAAEKVLEKMGRETISTHPDIQGVLSFTTTLGQAMDNFAAEKTLHNKPSTIDQYRRVIGKHFSDWLALPLQGLTKSQCLEKFYAIQSDIAEKGREGATGGTQANQAIGVVRLLWNREAFKSNESWGNNPMEGWGQNKIWFPTKTRKNFVQPDQMPAFVEAVNNLDSPVHRDFLLLLLFTGMRRREAEALPWADVDFDRRIITITEDRAKSSRELEIVMSDSIHDLLVARRSEVSGEVPWVFPWKTESGHITEPRGVLDQIAKETGINISPHDLRRTYTTVATAAGVHQFVMKALLNHAPSGDVTERYSITTVEMLRTVQQDITDEIKKQAGINGFQGDNVIEVKAS